MDCLNISNVDKRLGRDFAEFLRGKWESPPADFGDAVAALDRGDYARALWQFRELAEQGNGEAENFLGLMYSNGHGVPCDKEEASRWFRVAADRGQATAQHNLGLIYELGLGVLPNDRDAFLWYLKAASNDHVGAQVRVSRMFAAGQGCTKDLEKAASYARRAAEMGNEEAKSLVAAFNEPT